MIDRAAVVQQFLENSGYGEAERSLLAADASFRSYDRLQKADEKSVLMNAPPPEEDVRPFIAIAHALLDAGYSSPEIFFADCDAGLLLMEDLGDDLYFDIVGRISEQELYTAAVDLLCDLQAHRFDPSVKAPFSVTYTIPEYSDNLLLSEAQLLTNWYCPAALGTELSAAAKSEFDEIWRDLLPRARSGEPCLVLRDYHAQNLIWLPEREGVGRVGLLDFQDAVMGDGAYDLVSLLEDARRDVRPEVVQSMKDHYCAGRIARNQAFDQAAFLDAYAILAAQRNTKIIGIFTRLFKRDGKAQYLDLIPRVWKLLEADVEHPRLERYKAWLDRVLPAEIRSGELT